MERLSNKSPEKNMSKKKKTRMKKVVKKEIVDVKKANDFSFKSNNADEPKRYKTRHQVKMETILSEATCC